MESISNTVNQYKMIPKADYPILIYQDNGNKEKAPNIDGSVIQRENIQKSVRNILRCGKKELPIDQIKEEKEENYNHNKIVIFGTEIDLERRCFGWTMRDEKPPEILSREIEYRINEHEAKKGKFQYIYFIFDRVPSNPGSYRRPDVEYFKGLGEKLYKAFPKEIRKSVQVRVLQDRYNLTKLLLKPHKDKQGTVFSGTKDIIEIKSKGFGVHSEMIGKELEGIVESTKPDPGA